MLRNHEGKFLLLCFLQIGIVGAPRPAHDAGVSRGWLRRRDFEARSANVLGLEHGNAVELASSGRVLAADLPESRSWLGAVPKHGGLAIGQGGKEGGRLHRHCVELTG